MHQVVALHCSTGDTRTPLPNRNCELISYVVTSSGKEKKRGRPMGVPFTRIKICTNIHKT